MLATLVTFLISQVSSPIILDDVEFCAKLTNIALMFVTPDVSHPVTSNVTDVAPLPKVENILPKFVAFVGSSIIFDASNVTFPVEFNPIYWKMFKKLDIPLKSHPLTLTLTSAWALLPNSPKTDTVSVRELTSHNLRSRLTAVVAFSPNW